MLRPEMFLLLGAIVTSCLAQTPENATDVTTQAVTTQAVGPLPITEDVVHGDEPADFAPEVQRQLVWLDAQRYAYRDSGQWKVAKISGGQPEDLFAQDQMRQRIADNLELPEAAQGRIYRQTIDALLRDPQNLDRRITLTYQGQIYAYEDGTYRRIAGEDAEREVVYTGEGGKLVYCIRNNDLYAISAKSGNRRRLTRGATDMLLNGKLDWVYQEEIYGRGRWRGYWPSPDDRHVAYLQLDESAVPVYEIVREVERHPRTERTHYPKSGDPNPTVRLGVVSTFWGVTDWVDLSEYADLEFLITEVSWTPDGKLLYSVQDREQRWLHLNEYDPHNGRQRTLIQEFSPAWIESVPHPHWLPDGSFLWRSDRDGYTHLYHYERDGQLRNRLTEGTWEVRNLHGFHAETGWVYFSGTRETELEMHAYRVQLDGSQLQHLTEPGHTHSVRFSPDFAHFFDTYSNVTTPTRVALRSLDGHVVRMISDDDLEDLDKYTWSKPELVHLNARDGFRLHGLLIRPPNYDPNRRYPVWVMVYGGPGSQTVWNRWGGQRMLRDQLLAQWGYVVWKFDPRSGGGHGSAANWQAYQRLGQVELQDIEDGVQWLIDQGIADAGRVGITGHSYGGYMTAYALTHSKMFRLGISGAPVTDWHNYDTIYTERYMRTPVINPDGYQQSSVITAAGDLHGQLLIVHGALDDNVHFQNAVQLIEALQKQGKQFDVMVYPRDRHGIWNGREHYRELTYDYIREHL